jgi:26S proteasome regulatory subunit T5
MQSRVFNPTMSTAPPPGNPPSNNEQKPEDTEPSAPTSSEGAMDVSPNVPPEETWDDIPEDIMALNTEEISTRTRLIDNDIKVCFEDI